MGGKRYKKSPKITNLKKFFVNISLFLAAQVLVGIVFSIPMVYYGPFITIREELVNTAMTTLNHQYIVKWFLSDEVIEKIMKKSKINYENKESDVESIAVFDEDVQKDESQVQLINISNEKVKGYILLVKNPSMVRLATTNKIGVRGMKLLDMVKENNAIGGINAGGFGDEGGVGTGGIPMGLLMKNGEVLYGNENEKYSIIAFNEDSVLVLGSYTIQEAKELRIRDAVSFGPYLIVNGEPLIKGDSNGGWGLAPRTAIGQRMDGTVIMLVIDGRQISSIGATLRDVQDIMLEYGAYNAANLDGGSSTTMVYENRIVNSPSSKYGPRDLPSAFIISK
ncbi:MAG: phosphodiester glycosidase family protein [Clostridiales bacterium]|uniref:phosphodiester glycosidase family protein n=1 Tax=Clostridium sp. N3C TaxID=1776758 RepID=UPI00092DF9E0|nr:phosphodiester glycosidase family protein [Clostridium sp. N3C]NLZ47181.1 phosphodiester glycosidase family protein [Clostridiales bacterium]SCN23585.1 Exopolysaccharide biosynthesis protein related to N-acetylglucosamine-1-phosphodiester alpha-N-acetylglucosaminidase [Clostridium sp. N3C]